MPASPNRTISIPSRRRNPATGSSPSRSDWAKTVVEGGNTVRFCPKYPQHILQFFSTSETLRNGQQDFYALDLSGKPPGPDETHDILLLRHPLSTAEEDGTLHFVGSTYSADNEAIYDGSHAAGRRVVTLAPILKNKVFPLPQIA